MTALGFASGLPLPLSGFTLQQWMSETGLSLGAIGLTANLGLAYSLKFLWAPLLDAAPPPWPFRGLGRRRGWLLLAQLLLTSASAVLALSDPQHAPLAAFAAAGLVAFLSASQDILIDAWRIETFPPRLQGAAIASYVWGYRAALLVSGAGAIALATPWGWHGALLSMAAVGLAGPLATLATAEPAAGETPDPPLRTGGRWHSAIVEPLKEFMSRPFAAPILGFVFLFRLGEAMAGVMLAPFYHALGFNRATVALANGPVSLAAVLAGTALGGWLVTRLGVARALLFTGVGQSAAMAMYILLAVAGGNPRLLMATAMVESAAQGLSDAAFITYLSGLCARSFTATQYALLSSLAALAWRTVGGLAGFLAAGLGWRGFFTLTMAATLPAMAMMVYLLRRAVPVG